MSVVHFRLVCDDCNNPFTSDEKDDLCSSCQEEQRDAEYKGWKDQYTGYYGKEWEEIRESVLEEYGYECAECGMTDEEHRARDNIFPPNGGLHIHHIEKAKEFESYSEANKLENLTPLCADCHRKAEWG